MNKDNIAFGTEISRFLKTEFKYYDIAPMWRIFKNAAKRYKKIIRNNYKYTTKDVGYIESIRYSYGMYAVTQYLTMSIDCHDILSVSFEMQFHPRSSNPSDIPSVYFIISDTVKCEEKYNSVLEVFLKVFSDLMFYLSIELKNYEIIAEFEDRLNKAASVYNIKWGGTFFDAVGEKEEQKE